MQAHVVCLLMARAHRSLRMTYRSPSFCSRAERKQAMDPNAMKVRVVQPLLREGEVDFCFHKFVYAKEDPVRNRKQRHFLDPEKIKAACGDARVIVLCHPSELWPGPRRLGHDDGSDGCRRPEPALAAVCTPHAPGRLVI